jgi:hypothetical protein
VMREGSVTSAWYALESIGAPLDSPAKSI